MTTTDKVHQQRQPHAAPTAVPPVCLQVFDRFFTPLWRLRDQMEVDTNIPAGMQADVFQSVATVVAIQVVGSDLQAAALVYRTQMLLTAIDADVLEEIGDRYFDDREYLIRRPGPGKIELKTLAVMAAACADLLSCSGGFTVDALAAAVLVIPAGCPLDDCNADTE